MERMFRKSLSKNYLNDKSDENRRKSLLCVKSEDYDKNKYNYLKLNLKPNQTRSDAITELELIYDKLNEQLLDNELLDRAERRDLPFSHQLFWSSNHTNNDHNNNDISEHDFNGNDLKDRQMVSNNNNSYESLNKRRSMATIAALEALPYDYSYESMTGLRGDQWLSRSRTPPYRRSVIPDIIRDDFAIRKYNKSLSHSHLSSNQEISGFNSIKRINNNKNYSMSYLMTTSSSEDIYDSFNDNTNDSIYTNETDLKYLSKANIKVDDVLSRKIRQSSANNVLPPHPPFGIPNTIVAHSSVNDYIRSELDPKDPNKVRFRFKSSVPHLIRDDMAFRTLRKEEKSPKQELKDNSLPNKD